MYLSKRTFEVRRKTDSKFLTDVAVICDKGAMTAAMIRDMIK